MTYERKDFLKLVAQRRGTEAVDRIPALEMMAQAAVAAENLTGYPEWDLFLSYIQAAIETTKGHQTSFDAILKDPLITDENELRRARIAYFQCAERVLAWEVVLQLPKDLKESGEKAKDILGRLPEIQSSAQSESGADNG